jgi:hypothetical protein
VWKVHKNQITTTTWHALCFYKNRMLAFLPRKTAPQHQQTKLDQHMKTNRMTSFVAKSVTVLAACAALNASAGTAPAKAPLPPVEPEPSSLFDSVGATLDVGYDSRYYFRGLWFADNIVWSSLNLSIPLIAGSGEDGAGSLTWGLGATYISTVETPFNSFGFAGMPAAGTRSSTAFDYSEIDLVTSLTYDAGFAKFGVQYMHYFYPDTYSGSFNGVSNGGPSNNEFGIKGAGEIGFTVSIPLGAANIYAGYYYDFKVSGSYAQLGADYTIAITDWMSLVPSITTGYGNDYYTGNNSAFTPAVMTGNVGQPLGTTSGFTHILYSLAAPIKLTKIATLTPYIAMNQSLDARAALNATTNYEVFGGVKLSVAF